MPSLCPKTFDIKSWAISATYTTLLMFVGLFLMGIPFVWHPGLFETMHHLPSNPLSQVVHLGSSMYGAICVVAFGSLFIALLSGMCMIGIELGRWGLLIPYLIVKSLLAAIVAGLSILSFYALALMGDGGLESPPYVYDMLDITKAIVVLMVFLFNWIFITPVVLVSAHCHSLRRGSANSASLIAMEVPSATEDLSEYHV